MLIYATLEIWRDLIKTKYFMTISILTLKGKLNGEILLVRFFFVGYINFWVGYIKLKSNFDI